MAEVTIYTSAFCGFCHRAKRLLESKGVAFIEIDVTADAETRLTQGLSNYELAQMVSVRKVKFQRLGQPPTAPGMTTGVQSTRLVLV